MRYPVKCYRIYAGWYCHSLIGETGVNWIILKLEQEFKPRLIWHIIYFLISIDDKTGVPVLLKPIKIQINEILHRDTFWAIIQSCFKTEINWYIIA